MTVGTEGSDSSHNQPGERYFPNISVVLINESKLILICKMHESTMPQLALKLHMQSQVLVILICIFQFQQIKVIVVRQLNRKLSVKRSDINIPALICIAFPLLCGVREILQI